jgi:hypothetical protein
MNASRSYVVSINHRFCGAVFDKGVAESFALSLQGDVRLIEVYAGGEKVSATRWDEAKRLWVPSASLLPLAVV